MSISVVSFVQMKLFKPQTAHISMQIAPLDIRPTDQRELAFEGCVVSPHNIINDVHCQCDTVWSWR
jgi:hypothetical protein